MKINLSIIPQISQVNYLIRSKKGYWKNFVINNPLHWNAIRNLNQLKDLKALNIK